MKKVFVIVSMSLFFLFLTACGTSAAPASKVISETSLQEDLATEIGESIPYEYLTVKQAIDTKKYNVTLGIYNASEITNMASYIENLLDARDAVMDPSIRGRVFFEQCYEDGALMLSFRTTHEGFGELVDSRSGKSTVEKFDSFEEMTAAFPAYTVQQEITSGESEEDIAIYNEVMKALNAEPNRPEEEIFVELAPTYGMTSEELKEFMLDIIWK